MNKVIKIHRTGIELLSQDIIAMIQKKKLSPSLVESILNCPADWLMESFVLQQIEHEEAIHLVRGKLFHSVMEHFYALAPEQRARKALGPICNKLVNGEYKSIKNDLESIDWLKKLVENFLDMGFDYRGEKIATLALTKKSDSGELVAEPMSGLECFIRGKIGNTQREVVGIIDRVLQADDNTLIIDDWKTGKKAKDFNWDKPASQENSFGYIRQQTAYSLLCEQNGLEVSQSRLIFPAVKEVYEVPFAKEATRIKVIEDFERADNMLTQCLHGQFFPFGNQIFCGWCKEFNPKYRGRAKSPKVNTVQLVNITDYSEL